MKQHDLTRDDFVHRQTLTSHVRKLIGSLFAIFAEDETSVMTTYRGFYLQISFSELHPLMVFCIARPLERGAASLKLHTNELNLHSVLGSHFVNEDFSCYNYRATHWLETEINQARLFEILDRCVDEAERGYCALISGLNQES